MTDVKCKETGCHHRPQPSHRQCHPSKDDVEITRRLKAAGETLGIRVLDHIIFSHKGYYSFPENNELNG